MTSPLNLLRSASSGSAASRVAPTETTAPSTSAAQGDNPTMKFRSAILFARSATRGCAGLALGLALGLAAVAVLAPVPASAQIMTNKKEVGVLQTSFGKIVIEFYSDTAPKTVSTFKRNLRGGIYEGTLIHRIVPGVAIVGGDPFTKDQDPANDGAGGYGPPLPNEFSAAHKNVRGAVGALRKVDSANPDKQWNGFQFYIALSDQPSLDTSEHTVFGRVLEGMDIVDRIAGAGHDAATGTPKDRIDFKKAFIEAR